jgi:hypothetical protein
MAAVRSWWQCLWSDCRWSGRNLTTFWRNNFRISMKEYCEKCAFNNCQWVSSRTQIIYDCRRGDLQVEKERKRKEGKNMRNLQWLTRVGVIWMKVHYYQNLNFGILYFSRSTKQGHSNDLYHPLQNKTQHFYPNFFWFLYWAVIVIRIINWLIFAHVSHVFYSMQGRTDRQTGTDRQGQTDRHTDRDRQINGQTDRLRQTDR